MRPGGRTSRRRHDAFRAGLAPALIVLALITIAPAVFLVLTSLTPLNLTLPDTAWDFSTPLGNYLDLLDDPRFSRSVWVQVKLSVATGCGDRMFSAAAMVVKVAPDRDKRKGQAAATGHAHVSDFGSDHGTNRRCAIAHRRNNIRLSATSTTRPANA